MGGEWELRGGVKGEGILQCLSHLPLDRFLILNFEKN